MLPTDRPMPTQAPTLLEPTATQVTEPASSPSAVTAVPAVEDDVLYLNLMWHQHQPLYYKDDEGIYTRPWVRVHATKDYYDMASILADYPGVHVTFNLTPVLIRQLDDYVVNEAKDIYWVLSEIPAAELADEQKDFILRRFFDANWDNMIARFPRYLELLNQRGGVEDEDITQAMENFTEEDFRDLQVWFNLAWVDPDLYALEPLAALVEKGRDFTEDDKGVLFAEIRRIMAEVIPLHAQMQDAGQIEVTTTPYAHPILPLIYNSNLAEVGNPGADMPARHFSYVQDAVAHLSLAAASYNQHFGRDPRGLWPGEGAVAHELVPYISRVGFQWMATGEQVLAESLGIGAFNRDSAETVQEADQLYRPYFVDELPGDMVQGDPVLIFFRDNVISDKLAFTYSGMPGEEAAADFLQRVENIRQQLQAQGAEGPHVVSVILDGENAWEYYENDGKEFLHALYQSLQESETIQTVTPSEYMQMFPEQESLANLFPGAWFSPNYDTWIGELEENTAWTYLRQARRDLAAAEREGLVSTEALARAKDFMYLAEGSDWFWWYGTDQDSGQDDYFDVGFRALLSSVYRELDQPAPQFVDVPIIQDAPAAAAVPLKGLSTPVVDGTAGEEEWANAAVYPADGASPATELAYTLDAENLYFRITFGPSTQTVERVGFYFLSPGSSDELAGFTRPASTEPPVLLGIPAVRLVEWGGGSTLQSYFPSEGEWELEEEVGTTAASGQTREFSIPQAVLGDLRAGDDLRLVIVVQPQNQKLPLEGPAQIIIPDIGLANILLEVQDPQGDDTGPGTYTYPTDRVFEQGVFDLRSFTVAYDDENIIFRFEFHGPIPNPWNSPTGLAIQSLDVYIDQDPGAGTGARLLLPGRNAALSEGNGWEYAIWAEGWTPAVVVPDADTLAPESVGDASFRTIVDPAAQRVTLLVPRETLGGGDPAVWGYAAVVMGQEGYPATGVWRVRDVEAQASQWRFGGAPADTNHTRIIDLAWSEVEGGDQAQMLGAYPTRTERMDSLAVEDFAQIELLIP